MLNQRNHLNDPDIDGNILNLYSDDEYDEYYCKQCKRIVYEDQYNHKKSMCYTCWYRKD